MGIFTPRASEKMEVRTIAGLLGLPPTATVADIEATIAANKAAAAEVKTSKAAETTAKDASAEDRRQINLQTSLISDVKRELAAVTGVAPIDLGAAVIALQQFRVQRTQELVEIKALFAAIAEILGETAPMTPVEAASMVRRHHSVLVGYYATARGNPQVRDEGDHVHATNILHVLGVLMGQWAEATNRVNEARQDASVAKLAADELIAAAKRAADDVVATARRDVDNANANAERLQRQVENLMLEIRAKDELITSKNREVTMAYSHVGDQTEVITKAFKAAIEAKIAAASAKDPARKLGEELLGMIPEIIAKNLRGNNTNGSGRQPQGGGKPKGQGANP